MGGEIIRDFKRGPRYEGGLTIGKMIKEDTTLNQLTSMLAISLGDEVWSKHIMFNLKFDPHEVVDLVDDAGVTQLIQYNNQFGHAFLVDGESSRGIGSQHSQWYVLVCWSIGYLP